MEEEDINNFLSFHSELQGRTVEEIRKELETQMQMESVRNDVLGDKVYKFLAGVNKAEETKMTKKEYDLLLGSISRAKSSLISGLIFSFIS